MFAVRGQNFWDLRAFAVLGKRFQCPQRDISDSDDIFCLCRNVFSSRPEFLRPAWFFCIWQKLSVSAARYFWFQRYFFVFGEMFSVGARISEIGAIFLYLAKMFSVRREIFLVLTIFFCLCRNVFYARPEFLRHACFFCIWLVKVYSVRSDIFLIPPIFFWFCRNVFSVRPGFSRPAWFFCFQCSQQDISDSDETFLLMPKCLPCEAKIFKTGVTFRYLAKLFSVRSEIFLIRRYFSVFVEICFQCEARISETVLVFCIRQKFPVSYKNFLNMVTLFVIPGPAIIVFGCFWLFGKIFARLQFLSQAWFFCVG